MRWSPGADAASAKFTGNPDNLISALRKLESGVRQNPVEANPATAHMFIANPFGKDRGTSVNLFASHPPLEERIRRLEQLEMPQDAAAS